MCTGHVGPSSDGEFELLDYILCSTKHLMPNKAHSKVWVEDFKSELSYRGSGKNQKDLSDHLPIWGTFQFDFPRKSYAGDNDCSVEPLPTMQASNVSIIVS